MGDDAQVAHREAKDADMSTPQDPPNDQGGQGWNPPGGDAPDQNGYGQQGTYGRPEDQPAQQNPYGYSSGQPSGYAYPTGGAGYGSDVSAGTGKGPAPKEVERAYQLIIAAGVLYLLSTVLSTLTTDVPDVAGASLGVGLGIVLAVVLAGVYVVLAVFIRKGQNWARITATVLSALNVLSVLSTFLLLPMFEQMAEASGQPVPETSGLTVALSVLVMLLGVAGVVMTYLKPARPYFRPRQLGY